MVRSKSLVKAVKLNKTYIVIILSISTENDSVALANAIATALVFAGFYSPVDIGSL